MKKLLIILSALLSVAYIVIYTINAPRLAKMHMTDEFAIFYMPLLAGLIAVITLAVMLIIYKIKHFDEKLFFIPMFFFISSLLTSIIGSATPCEYCDLPKF